MPDDDARRKRSEAFWQSEVEEGREIRRARLFDCPQSEIEIVAPDGTVRHRTRAMVYKKSVTDPTASIVDDPGGMIVADPSLVIERGDEIRRRIPSGKEETFEVIEPVFREKSEFPAHYQVIVRKKGVFAGGQGGNYNSVHVTGSNARINIGSHDHSMNIVTEGDIFTYITDALHEDVKSPDELRKLLSAVDEMKRQRGGAGFAAAYRSFVSLAADHLGILAPFLPALSQLL
jgi:hypothetical protein